MVYISNVANESPGEKSRGFPATNPLRHVGSRDASQTLLQSIIRIKIQIILSGFSFLKCFQAIYTQLLGTIKDVVSQALDSHGTEAPSITTEVLELALKDNLSSLMFNIPDKSPSRDTPSRGSIATSSPSPKQLHTPIISKASPCPSESSIEKVVVKMESEDATEMLSDEAATPLRKRPVIQNEVHNEQSSPQEPAEKQQKTNSFLGPDQASNMSKATSQLLTLIELNALNAEIKNQHPNYDDMTNTNTLNIMNHDSHLFGKHGFTKPSLNMISNSNLLLSNSVNNPLFSAVLSKHLQQPKVFSPELIRTSQNSKSVVKQEAFSSIDSKPLISSNQAWPNKHGLPANLTGTISSSSILFLYLL